MNHHRRAPGSPRKLTGKRTVVYRCTGSAPGSVPGSGLLRETGAVKQIHAGLCLSHGTSEAVITLLGVPGRMGGWALGLKMQHILG